MKSKVFALQKKTIMSSLKRTHQLRAETSLAITDQTALHWDQIWPLNQWPFHHRKGEMTLPLCGGGTDATLQSILQFQATGHSHNASLWKSRPHSCLCVDAWLCIMHPPKRFIKAQRWECNAYTQLSYEWLLFIPSVQWLGTALWKARCFHHFLHTYTHKHTHSYSHKHTYKSHKSLLKR